MELKEFQILIEQVQGAGVPELGFDLVLKCGVPKRMTVVLVLLVVRLGGGVAT